MQAGWVVSRTEILSALARRHRDGQLSENGLVASRERRDELFASMHVITDLAEVIRRADRLLLAHPLRSADALQLGAALLAAADLPSGHMFVTFDARLGTAARREGFAVGPQQ